MPKAPIELPCACSDNAKVVAAARKVLQALKGHQLEDLTQLCSAAANARLRSYDFETLASYYQTPTGKEVSRWNGLLSEDVLYECSAGLIYADVLFAKETGNGEEEDTFFCVRMLQEDTEWRYFDTFAKTASSIRGGGTAMRSSVHEARESYRMSISAPPRSWNSPQNQAMHVGKTFPTPPSASPFLNRKRSTRPTNLPRIDMPPISPLASRNENYAGVGGSGGVGGEGLGGYLLPPERDSARSSVSSEGGSSAVGSEYEDDLWEPARSPMGHIGVVAVQQSMDGLWALAAMMGLSPAQFMDCAAHACNMPILTHNLSEPPSRNVIAPAPKSPPKQHANEFFGPGTSRLLGAR